ncbi:glycosyltransferase family 4 protein [Cognatishimia sp. SS12]|uniref:glycosyltransferase family 4 protein n=1 Tax=Cognatishimia sp. SS12 TaxID=2979465 RepID=UPI00232FF76B|nr:glycosyltransferase family 4 protein [Cognatishimia sp. SS12]MDC0737918.1 glycosyltransferase family 4 protein [Cognatishimia sp. SS12]
MNILFIHQNFPGQFKNLAPALAARGDRCVALTLRVKEPTNWKGVRVLPYRVQRKQGTGTHPWLKDFDTKVLRGEACMRAARALKERGFEPDVIIAHPGWGESLFLRDVWPKARIGLYYELFYQEHAADAGFDPEFPRSDDADDAMRLRLKNLNNMMHFPLGDMGLSPTKYQAATFPEPYQERISVIHDGIDTARAVPDENVRFALPDGQQLTRKDEVITFVNRNLEPYRGYHIFMRALPQLLRDRPHARILIVGGEGQSYGAAPTDGISWKQRFIDEVRGEISDADWARVHFLGKIPYEHFLKLLQLARVHVYLTYPFVLSWSLLEAMSCGAAIVASNTPPVREVIKDGVTGRLVDFFDSAALAGRISDLLNDPDARATLGTQARALIKTRYDLTSVCLPEQLTWVDRLARTKPGGTGS